GFAERGKSWQWISTYYFPGSYTSQLGSDPTVVVHLTTDKRYEANWTLVPMGGTRLEIDKNDDTTFESLGKVDESFTFAYDSGTGKVKATGNQGSVFTGLSTYKFRVTTNSSPRLIQVSDPSGYRNLANRVYRGDIEMREGSGKLQLRNILGMEGYIKGVLPGEMGSAAWDMDALKTQAVCARSYAYIGDIRGAVLECDTDDQVYLGYSSENATLNDAVDGTSRTVLKHSKAPASDNHVIQTFFHSSSGGHTARIEQIWSGTGFPSSVYPYYGGVDDPYCDDAGSPNDPWPSVTKNGLQIASAIAPKISGEPAGAGTTVWVKAISINRYSDSGFVNTVDLTWSNGAKSLGVGGSTFANALGLKSRKYYIGVPWDRIALGDRYSTAVEVSAMLYPAGSTPGVVVIANGSDEKYADSLTASGLAGQAGGPVLLTRPDALPSAVRSEISRLKGLGATKAYIVGGVTSVEPAVFASVEAIMGAGNVERLAGGGAYATDRYGTAASVAMEMKDLGASGASVLVASGQKWTDAAIASAASAGSGRPVVLVAQSKLPDSSAQVLADLGATETVVFGGPNTISDAAIAQLCAATGESKPSLRFGMVGGRYDVAVQSALWCQGTFGYSPAAVYVTSGEKFADSVTGGVLAGENKNPLVLTAANSVPKATESYMKTQASTCTKMYVVGGIYSISNGCAQVMARILG
ncbi:MAG: cell wall-binding repeat-containing protein, partial [Coriobacteriia bacterium]|nr:cell wall-binding repeat-containing protein [Coriobacteriia bacterium]